MTVELLRDFFFWSMIVNSIVYMVTALATFLMPGFIASVQNRVFNMDELATLASIQRYLGNYKLLITAFNFAPWVALHIIA